MARCGICTGHGYNCPRREELAGASSLLLVRVLRRLPSACQPLNGYEIHILYRKAALIQLAFFAYDDVLDAASFFNDISGESKLRPSPFSADRVMDDAPVRSQDVSGRIGQVSGADGTQSGFPRKRRSPILYKADILAVRFLRLSGRAPRDIAYLAF
jgi:hypothetical protein